MIAGLEGPATVKLLQVPFTGVDWLEPAELPAGCAAANVHGMDPPIAEYVLGTMLDWAVGFSALSVEFKADGVFRPPFPVNVAVRNTCTPSGATAQIKWRSLTAAAASGVSGRGTRAGRSTANSAGRP